MKNPLKWLLIIIILAPVSAFLVMGMFMYGLLPFPPETIKKTYTSETGEKVILKGVKEQGWGSDGFSWKGQYLSNKHSQSQTRFFWLGHDESFIPEVYFGQDVIVIIEDFRNFRVKDIADNWQSYFLGKDDYNYISSLDSQINSIQKDLPERVYPYIDKFIPATQELKIKFSQSPYDHTPTLANLTLFISSTGEITTTLPKKSANKYYSEK